MGPPRGTQQTPGYRIIWPPRLVEVFQAGTWHKAQLEGLREIPCGLLSLVRLNTSSRNYPASTVWLESDKVRSRTKRSPDA